MQRALRLTQDAVLSSSPLCIGPARLRMVRIAGTRARSSGSCTSMVGHSWCPTVQDSDLDHTRNEVRASCRFLQQRKRLFQVKNPTAGASQLSNPPQSPVLSPTHWSPRPLHNRPWPPPTPGERRHGQAMGEGSLKTRSIEGNHPEMAVASGWFVGGVGVKE